MKKNIQFLMMVLGMAILNLNCTTTNLVSCGLIGVWHPVKLDHLFDDLVTNTTHPSSQLILCNDNVGIAFDEKFRYNVSRDSVLQLGYESYHILKVDCDSLIIKSMPRYGYYKIMHFSRLENKTPSCID